MNKESKSGGAVERGSRFFRNVHVAIGAVALGASLVFESAVLPVVAVFEFGHAALWEGIRRFAGRKKAGQPALA